MDWQRVSRIPFTWIRTLKREVLTAALEKHGESHSELKFSTGLFLFFFFFLFQAASVPRPHNPGFGKPECVPPSQHIHASTAMPSDVDGGWSPRLTSWK